MDDATHMARGVERMIGWRGWRTGLLAGALSLAVVVSAGYLADRQNNALHNEQARADVAMHLSHLRADLESNLYSSIQLVRGLVGIVQSNPDIEQEAFADIASRLLSDDPQIRNIAGAPHLVIELMYPLAGNEAAIGLNYLSHPTQRDAVMAAINQRSVVLAGPVDLVQGGRGLIARYPVIVENETGRSVTWGLLAAVIDVDRFYANSGLLKDDLPIDVAISGRDANLSDHTVFFGNPDILAQDPVTAQVSLPTGGWHLSAIPRGGWPQTPSNALWFRTMLVIAGLLVVVPIAIAGFFYDQLHARARKLMLQENELRALSHRLDLALETSQIGVWELNIDTGKLSWDRRIREIYGVEPGINPDSAGHWIDKLHPEDREQAVAEFDHAVKTGETYRSEFRIIPFEGAVRWIRTIGASHTGLSGDRIITGVNWDATDELQLKAELIEANRVAETRNHELEETRLQLEHNSLHDVLTGLPNRRFLEERVFAFSDDICPTALLHIDLDRFKHINDTLGHAAGDAMLIHAANVLRDNTRGTDQQRDGDIVARVGGDEFVIVTMQPVSSEQLRALAERIIDHMCRPVPYNNQNCRIGASIGIAHNSGGARGSIDQLLVDADLALYRAKKRGRARYEFFDASLKAEIIAQRKVADEILVGIEREEFVPHFQLQFDAKTLDVSGVEALARWEHPTRGLLPPGAFLEIAEDLNVIPLIDEMILRKTLFEARRWEAAGIKIPKKSVNVSAGQLNDPDLIYRLGDLPIWPGEFSFELLESIFLDEENETVAHNIKQLASLGIDIELDDFGTGHASIIGLMQLKPSRLKIERRLVNPIVTSPDQRQIVASIIEIGRALDIGIVAEGVETMDHLAILRDMGCGMLQGYALAKPMPSSNLIDFVANETWRKKAA